MCAIMMWCGQEDMGEMEASLGRRTTIIVWFRRHGTCQKRRTPTTARSTTTPATIWGKK